MSTKGNGENKFAPGFLLVVDGLLASRQKNATTPEEALTNLWRSKHGYLVAPGTKVRVFRVVEEGDNDAVTELYGEQVELEPIVSTERVLRHIYSSSLNVTIDFRFDVVPGEAWLGYEDLLRERQALCPRIQNIRLESVVMTDDVHECDETCEFFGVSGYGGASHSHE